MIKHEFEILKLSNGDHIWLMNEGGEGFHGNYLGEYDNQKQTFKFRNHSNGQDQIIDIGKLQRLQREE